MALAMPSMPQHRAVLQQAVANVTLGGMPVNKVMAAAQRQMAALVAAAGQQRKRLLLSYRQYLGLEDHDGQPSPPPSPSGRSEAGPGIRGPALGEGCIMADNLVQ